MTKRRVKAWTRLRRLQGGIHVVERYAKHPEGWDALDMQEFFLLSATRLR